jgi:hypothetical protein
VERWQKLFHFAEQNKTRASLPEAKEPCFFLSHLLSRSLAATTTGGNELLVSDVAPASTRAAGGIETELDQLGLSARARQLRRHTHP